MFTDTGHYWKKKCSLSLSLSNITCTGFNIREIFFLFVYENDIFLHI